MLKVPRNEASTLSYGSLENGSEIQQALEQITGQRTVPNIFINGNHIGGSDSLIKLRDDGKLEALLKK